MKDVENMNWCICSDGVGGRMMRELKTRMLEHSYMTEVMLRLRETEGLCITDLCNTGAGINGTRYRRVVELLDAGLAEARIGSGKCHNRKSIYLTEKGRKVADSLASLEELMG